MERHSWMSVWVMDALSGLMCIGCHSLGRLESGSRKGLILTIQIGFRGCVAWRIG